MNSAQRQTLRQTLIDLGFERSSTQEVNHGNWSSGADAARARPGEYDESWISDNADEVEIRWAARTKENADEPRVVTAEDEELLDSDGHEHRAGWLHDGDLFCEPGMDAHIVSHRADRGDTVLITDTEGIEISLDSDTVVSVITGTRLGMRSQHPIGEEAAEERRWSRGDDDE